ncbi:protein kinase C-binding protein NELL1, partial [Asbolus verrucosus]
SYQSCRSDVDCKPNSFCFGNDDDREGKCKCFEGYELIRNTTFYECLQGVKLGDPCEKDIQCVITASNLARCDQYKVCSCKSEAHGYSDGICYLRISVVMYKSVFNESSYFLELNEVCVSDANCYLGNDNYGFCTHGRCRCPVRPIVQRPSANRTYCIPAKKMGEECLSDEECSFIPNARCLEVCRCPSGYTLSRSGKACVKAATQFGDSCTYDGNCEEYLSRSTCLNNRCECGEDLHGYGNRCVETRRAGQNCEEDAQCVYKNQLEENVKCQHGVCSCIYGMTGDK